MKTGLEIDTYEEAIEFLFGRINYERAAVIPRTFKLDRMRVLASLLGDPQLGLPVVHIAGTKGKGSTARFTAEVLKAAGYHVGLYTSPHLQRVEERIWINGQICSPAQFAALVGEVQRAVHKMDSDKKSATAPTYFEIITAMAMKSFRDHSVDLAVLEVGLGGRLDSTNICQPVCCAITSISLDHTKQLGNDVESIAVEKAGIIKPGIPVVSGVQDNRAAAVIAEIARDRNAPLIQAGRDFGIVGDHPASQRPGSSCSQFRFVMADSEWAVQLPELETQILGDHQIQNAATAVAICDILHRSNWPIAPENVRQGIRNTQIPARIELIRKSPPVILDTAHNEASISALIETIDRHWSHLPKTVIFGATRGKQIQPMLQQLTRWADHLILTPYLTNPRSCTSQELTEAVNQASERRAVVTRAANPEEAWQLVQADLVDRLVCITGSFFLAGELRDSAARLGGCG